MDSKKIFVWKELKIHSGDAIALLAIAVDEDEARRLVLHRLQENFHLAEADAMAVLAGEPTPDVWHTETQPVFEIDAIQPPEDGTALRN